MSLLTEVEREYVAAADVAAEIAIESFPLGSWELDIALRVKELTALVHRLSETPFEES